MSEPRVSRNKILVAIVAVVVVVVLIVWMSGNRRGQPTEPATGGPIPVDGFIDEVRQFEPDIQLPATSNNETDDEE